LQVQSFHRVHGQGNAAHRLVLPHPLAHIAKVISNQAAWKVLGRSRHGDDARRNKREIEVEVVILEPMPPEGSCACRRGSEGEKSIQPAEIFPVANFSSSNVKSTSDGETMASSNKYHVTHESSHL
jgi:hypothetical protein